MQNLPPLPGIAPRVIKLVESPDTSAADLERVIRMDAALTAKLLRTANCPFYRTSIQEVTHLRRAIAMLGMRTVRSVVLGVVFRSFLGTSDGSKGLSTESTWRHALAVAVGSRILAVLRRSADPEEAFLAGLLHDLGKSVAFQYAPNEVADVLADVAQHKIPMLEAELDLLGIDHQEIGAIAVDRWGMPGHVKAAASFHHNPKSRKLAENDQPIVYMVHMANCLAHTLGYDLRISEPIPTPDPVVTDYLNLPEAQWDPISEVLTMEVKRAEEAFGID